MTRYMLPFVGSCFGGCFIYIYMNIGSRKLGKMVFLEIFFLNICVCTHARLRFQCVSAVFVPHRLVSCGNSLFSATLPPTYLGEVPKQLVDNHVRKFKSGTREKNGHNYRERYVSSYFVVQIGDLPYC